MKAFEHSLAKLSRPRLYGGVRRERLFARLDSLRRHPLIWVAGPPGAGKTSLVASWLDARKLAGVWYQVDSGDADAATLVHYLGMAAHQSGSRTRTGLPSFTPETTQDLPGFMRRYFRELFACLPRPSVLVFDNFQEAEAPLELKTAFAAAMEEVPEQVNVIIVSRAEPGPEMARLIANQRVGQISWDELRFTLDESHELLAAVESAHERQSLHEMSDGWAAGLILVREHALRFGDTGIRTGSCEAVFDYFAGEIFAGVAPDAQRLLLATALLPHVTVEIAETLCGIQNAGRILEQMYRRHLFITRRQGSPPVYQYHALFRAFLESRAREQFTAQERTQLAAHAARWLERNGNLDDAVALYRQAGNSAELARIVLAHADEVLAQGRRQTLLEWIDALPAAERARNGWLMYWRGRALMALVPSDSRRDFESAFAIFSAAQDRTGMAMTAASIIGSYYLESIDFTPMDRWIAVLSELLTAGVTFVSEEAELRVSTAMLIAMLYRRPQHPALARFVERVERLLDGAAGFNQKVASATALLNYLSYTGQLDDARQLVARASAWANRAGVNPSNRVLWWLQRGYHHYVLMERDEALAAYAEARRMAFAAGLGTVEGAISRIELSLALLARDAVAAESLIARVDVLIDPARTLDVAYTHNTRSLLASLQHDPALALRHAETAFDLACRAGSPYHQAVFLNRVAQVHADQGMLEQAIALFEDSRARVAGASFRLVNFQTLMLEAHVAAQAGRTHHCRQLLAEAFSIGRANSFSDKLWWIPKSVVARLCQQALEAGIETQFTLALIRTHGLLPDSPGAVNWPWQVEVRTLGQSAVKLDGQVLKTHNKTRGRPLDLLKGLVAMGGKDVDGAALAALLWPDTDGDSARVAFDTTLHRLRKLLASEGAVPLHNGKLSLNPRKVWFDTATFEQLASDALEALSREPAADGVRLAEHALALYRGHFLEGEPEQSWMLPYRARLKSRFFRLLAALGQHREEAGCWTEAINLYERGLELDNLAEDLYRRLMLCHRTLGQNAAALNVYRRCRDMLSIVLGLTPSAQTQAVYRSLAPASVPADSQP